MNIDRPLFSLLKKERMSFYSSILSGVISAGMLIAQAHYLSQLIDQLFIRSASLESLMTPLLLFALFSILRMGLGWYSHAQANRATIAIRGSLTRRLLEKVGKLGPVFTRNVQSGQLNTTLIKGVESLDPYFSQYIPQLFFALYTPLLIVAAIFPSDYVSAIILLLSAPLIPLFMILIGKSASAMTEKQWKTMSRMSGYFLDVMQGLPTLKLFAQSRRQHDAIEKSGEEFRHATMRVLRVAFLSSLTLELVGTIGTAIIAVGIGLRLMNGTISFQHAFFVLLLTPDFYLPLRQLGTKFHAGMEGVTASKEIFGILNQPGPDTATTTTQPAPHEEPAYNEFATPAPAHIATLPLTFTAISCTYPGATVPALNDVSFTIPAGKTTAIIGPSGAGKSTIINLILRFLEPTAGTITIGTTALSAINRESWHQQISWVPQHPYLFNASLRQNIMIASPDAPAPALQKALQLSALNELIASLPDGLDTIIGEQGARLSGGEAQRVALARAFLKNAPLLILDEPTSHTDPNLEAELRTSISALMQNRTTIIIAHRLETIKAAEQIIVMLQGTISTTGTHETLRNAPGFYHDAIHRQPVPIP